MYVPYLALTKFLPLFKIALSTSFNETKTICKPFLTVPCIVIRPDKNLIFFLFSFSPIFSWFFSFLPDLLKKKKKKILIFFFYQFVFLLPYFILIFLISLLFSYSSLFFSQVFQILSQFSYSNGGNVVRLPFFPRESSSFFVLLEGGVVEGKTKKLFFLVLTITPV